LHYLLQLSTAREGLFFVSDEECGKARPMKRYAGMKGVAVLAGLVIVGVAAVAAADFLIILRDGKEIRVSHYEDVGDQIVYTRYGGKVAIPKARVASIKDLSGAERRASERPGTVPELKVGPPETGAPARTSPAAPQGPTQEADRSSKAANREGDLIGFLPKAGSMSKFKGTNNYFSRQSRQRMFPSQKTTFEGTLYADWQHNMGKDYFITRYDDREFSVGGHELLQMTEAVRTMDVTHNQLAWRSLHTKASGSLRQLDQVDSYDPPAVILPWPPTERSTVKQTYTRSTKPKNGAPYGTIVACLTEVKGEETIHTVAGTFAAVRVQTICTPAVNRTTWWVKGVGLVRWQVDTVSVNQNGELIEFKPSEKEPRKYHAGHRCVDCTESTALHIVSPVDGSIVPAGKDITVVVHVAEAACHDTVEVHAEDSVPSPPKAVPPFEFTIHIPGHLFGPKRIEAACATKSGEVLVSPVVTIHVKNAAR
jgi:hypothetical protein